MLSELEIRDLGPIHHAIISPHPGMNAITGETGAGKSMLLSAVDLISGGAAQPQRVAVGAEQSWVQAVCDVSGNSAVLHATEEMGAPCDDGELFITRTVPREGRSKVLVNGRSVPRSAVQELSEQLVTVHGQSEQLRIALSAKQRDFLDNFAQNSTELAQYREAFEHYRELVTKLENLKNSHDKTHAQIDYLRDSIARIDAVVPHAGEDDELISQREYIESAAQIVVARAEAARYIDTDGDNSSDNVSELISKAIHALRAVEHISEIRELIERLESAQTEIEDISYALSGMAVDDVNPADLDKINSRIFELNDLKKKWGPSLADVIEWRKNAEFELEDLDASPERIAELESQVYEAFAAAHAKAQEVSHSRTQAGRELSEGVNAELASLAMGSSAFRVRVEVREAVEHSGLLDAYGIDNVYFEFMPFPDSPWLPLGKSASGGELSRLMLALELVSYERRYVSQNSATRSDTHADIPTLIFDEIDAGVGGIAASDLGKRLALLSRHAQVIVVTHLPQVAAYAHKHFVVSKGLEVGEPNVDSSLSSDSISESASVITSVHAVDAENRVQEIARMLSGSLSEVSLAHAAELIETSKI